MISICTIVGRNEKILAEQAIKKVCSALGVDWIVCRGLYLYDNRNTCIDMAKGNDVLFWDSDIIATAEDVRKLLSRDLPIVSGAYQQRGTECYCRDIPYTTTGLIEVSSCGAGFLFIKNEVFKKFNDKFYFWNYKQDPGEDIGFCINAKKAGYKIYVDCDCKVKHLTETRDKMSEQVNTETKIAVLEQNIKQIAASIYDLTISVQVAQKIGVKEGLEGKVNRLENFTKMLYEYEAILTEIQKSEQVKVADADNK